MRKKLHDYVIEQLRDGSSISWNEGAENALKYAKLTNRAPRLGDFVPCNEDGDVLEYPMTFDYRSENGSVPKHPQESYESDLEQYQAAQDRVIFKGDWEVVYSKEDETCINYDGLSITFTKNYCFCIHVINRIEDLPLEIEFKEGLI